MTMLKTRAVTGCRALVVRTNNVVTKTHPGFSNNKGVVGGHRRTHHVCAAVASPSAAKESAHGTVVKFVCPEFVCSFGQELGIVGSCPELGAWKAAGAVRMKWAPGHSWTAEVVLGQASAANAEYKVVLIDGRSSSCTFEPGVNRKLRLKQTSEGGQARRAVEVICSWGLIKDLVEESHSSGISAAPAAEAAVPAAATPGQAASCQVVVPLYGEQPGQVVALVGSLPELGAWNASNAVKLRKGVDGMWRADLRLPVGVKFEAKVIILHDKGPAQWESGPNRVLQLQPPSQSMGEGCDPGGFLVVAHYGLPVYSQVVYRAWMGTGAGAPKLSKNVRATCQFTIPNFPTNTGQSLLVVGSLPQLGAWNPLQGLPLQWQPGHAWQGSVELAADAEVEVKMVFCDHGAFKWEPGPNRRISVARLLQGLAAATAGGSSSSSGGGAAVRGGDGGAGGAAPSSANLVLGEVDKVNLYPMCYWGTQDTPVLVLPEYTFIKQAVPEVVTDVVPEVEVEVVTPKVQEPKKSKWTRPKPHNPVTVVMDAARDAASEGQDQDLLRFLTFLIANGGADTSPSAPADPDAAATQAAAYEAEVESTSAMAAELAQSLSQQAEALHAEVSALQATHASLLAAVHDAQAQLARVGELQADAGVGSEVSHRLGREREEVEARVEALQAQHLDVQAQLDLKLGGLTKLAEAAATAYEDQLAAQRVELTQLASRQVQQAEARMAQQLQALHLEVGQLQAQVVRAQVMGEQGAGGEGGNRGGADEHATQTAATAGELGAPATQEAAARRAAEARAALSSALGGAALSVAEDHARLEASLTRLAQSHASHAARLRDAGEHQLAGVLGKASEDVQALVASHAAAVAALHSQLDTAKGMLELELLAVALPDTADRSQEVQSLQAQLSDALSRAASARGEADARLEALQSERKAQVEALEGQIQAAHAAGEGALEAVRAELRQVEADAFRQRADLQAQLRQAKDAAAEQAALLQSTLDSVRETNSKYLARVLVMLKDAKWDAEQQAECQHDLLVSQQNAAAGKLQALIAQLEEASTAVNTLQAQLQQARSEAEQQVGDLEEKVARGAAELQAAQGRLAAAQQAHAEEMQKQLRSLRDREAEISALQEQVVQAQSSGDAQACAAQQRLQAVEAAAAEKVAALQAALHAAQEQGAQALAAAQLEAGQMQHAQLALIEELRGAVASAESRAPQLAAAEVERVGQDGAARVASLQAQLADLQAQHALVLERLISDHKAELAAALQGADAKVADADALHAAGVRELMQEQERVLASLRWDHAQGLAQAQARALDLERSVQLQLQQAAADKEAALVAAQGQHQEQLAAVKAQLQGEVAAAQAKLREVEEAASASQEGHARELAQLEARHRQEVEAAQQERAWEVARLRAAVGDAEAAADARARERAQQAAQEAEGRLRAEGRHLQAITAQHARQVQALRAEAEAAGSAAAAEIGELKQRLADACAAAVAQAEAADAESAQLLAEAEAQYQQLYTQSQQEVEQLQEDVQQLRSSLEREQQERGVLGAAATAAARSVEEVRAQMGEQQEIHSRDVAALQSQLREVEEGKAASLQQAEARHAEALSQAMLQAQQGTTADGRAAIERLEQRLAQVSAAYATAAMERDGAQAQADASALELAQLRQQLDEAAASPEFQLGASLGDMWGSGGGGARPEAAAVRAVLDAGRQRVRELEACVADKEVEVASLQADLGAAARKQQESMAHSEGLAAEVARLAAALAGSEADRDALSKAAACSEAVMAKLQQQLSVLEAQGGEVQSLRVRVDAVAAERDQALGRVAEAEAAAQEAAALLAGAREGAAREVEAVLSMQQAGVGQDAEGGAAASGPFAMLRGQVSSLQGALHQACAELETLRSEKQQLLEARVVLVGGDQDSASGGAAASLSLHDLHLKLAAVRAEEEAIRDREVVKAKADAARMYDVRTAAQAQLLLAAKDADVRSAVQAATKASQELLSAKEAEVLRLTAALNTLSAQMQQLQLAILQGGSTVAHKPPALTRAVAGGRGSHSQQANAVPRWLSRLLGGKVGSLLPRVALPFGLKPQTAADAATSLLSVSTPAAQTAAKRRKQWVRGSAGAPTPSTGTGSAQGGKVGQTLLPKAAGRTRGAKQWASARASGLLPDSPGPGAVVPSSAAIFEWLDLVARQGPGPFACVGMGNASGGGGHGSGPGPDGMGFGGAAAASLA